MKNRRFIPQLLYIVMLFALFSWALDLFDSNLNQMPYSQVLSLFHQEQVRAFEVKDKVITMELYTPMEGENVVSATLADPEGFLPPTVEELCAEVEQHIGEMVELYGEPGAIKLSRKMLHDYFKGRGFPGVFRAQASHLADFAAVKGFLAEAKRLRSGPVPCCRS